MAKNIEINVLNSFGSYEVLYPATLGELIIGAVNEAATATSASYCDTALALTTARAIRTNLESTSTANFNGTSDITPGVTGILPVTNGGTGKNVPLITYGTTDLVAGSSPLPTGTIYLVYE